MPNYQLTRIDGAVFPLYLLKKERNKVIKQEDILEMYSLLSNELSPEWGVARVATPDPDFHPFMGHHPAVDPLVWSPDFIEYYGYMIYL